jgi:hypothetical protein
MLEIVGNDRSRALKNLSLSNQKYYRYSNIVLHPNHSGPDGLYSWQLLKIIN